MGPFIPLWVKNQVPASAGDWGYCVDVSCVDMKGEGILITSKGRRGVTCFRAATFHSVSQLCDSSLRTVAALSSAALKEGRYTSLSSPEG